MYLINGFQEGSIKSGEEGRLTLCAVELKSDDEEGFTTGRGTRVGGER